jgi:hypothetical protein
MIISGTAGWGLLCGVVGIGSFLARRNLFPEGFLELVRECVTRNNYFDHTSPSVPRPWVQTREIKLWWFGEGRGKQLRLYAQTDLKEERALLRIDLFQHKVNPKTNLVETTFEMYAPRSGYFPLPLRSLNEKGKGLSQIPLEDLLLVMAQKIEGFRQVIEAFLRTDR